MSSIYAGHSAKRYLPNRRGIGEKCAGETAALVTRPAETCSFPDGDAFICDSRASWPAIGGEIELSSSWMKILCSFVLRDRR